MKKQTTPAAIIVAFHMFASGSSTHTCQLTYATPNSGIASMSKNHRFIFTT